MSVRPSVRFTFALVVALVVASLAGRWERAAEGAYPGVNGKIVFQSEQGGAGWDIYTMDADGSAQAPFVDPGSDQTPAWSPDGSRIAFARGTADIYVMNADGTGVTNVTNSPMSEYDPDWSPDGSKLAFEVELGTGHQEIFVVNVDGSGLKQVTNNGSYNVQPAWSPDGSQIAFASDSAGSGFDVYAISPDGSGQVNLTNHGSYDDAPDWSPDGSQIAFRSNRNGSGDVYVMNADGTNQTRLTTHPDYDGEPSWSPDGSQIAFVRVLLPAVNFEIFVMNADGSGPVQLTDHPAHDAVPDWQPVTSDSDGDGLTDAIEMIAVGSDPADPDTDGDACTDNRETDVHPPSRGGRRDPNNFWDVMDVPSGTMMGRDGGVSGGDISAVVMRMGANDATPGDFYQDSDPLSTPNAPAMPSGMRSNYHPAYDRGGTVQGGEPWDLLPPDGSISGGDIAAVVFQFGHSCMMPMT